MWNEGLTETNIKYIRYITIVYSIKLSIFHMFYRLQAMYYDYLVFSIEFNLYSKIYPSRYQCTFFFTLNWIRKTHFQETIIDICGSPYTLFYNKLGTHERPNKKVKNSQGWPLYSLFIDGVMKLQRNE